MGDSHARHWLPAFDIVASRLGLNVTARPMVSCPPSVTPVKFWTRETGTRAFVECVDWVRQGVDLALKERPAAVVFAACAKVYTPAVQNSSATVVAEGVVQAARRIIAADIPVLFIKSTPMMPVNIPDCLAMEAKRSPGAIVAPSCSVTKQKGLAKESPADTAGNLYPIMKRLAFDDVFCVDGTCPPVIGNVVVYQDTHHLTRPFSQSLANALERRLLEAARLLGTH